MQKKPVVYTENPYSYNFIALKNSKTKVKETNQKIVEKDLRRKI